MSNYNVMCSNMKRQILYRDTEMAPCWRRTATGALNVEIEDTSRGSTVALKEYTSAM